MPSVPNVLPAGNLQNLTDTKTFERGRRYQQEGRVSALRRNGTAISASVAGSKAYEVKLWVKPQGLAYVCSCPMGDEGAFCKHAVAVALAMVASSEVATAAESAGQEADPAAAADNDRGPEQAPEQLADTIPDEAGATVFVAPQALPPTSRRSLFLAGSIEMGRATSWQTEVVSELGDLSPLAIFNPRRDDWDATWEQTIEHPQFRQQVEWELDAMDHADVIAMYFEPDTKSPITLLELGLYAASGKLVVCCPAGFWRKGNVDVVCRRHGIHLTHDLRELCRAVRSRLRQRPAAG